MKENFLEQCLFLLNKKEIKEQIKEILNPFLQIITKTLLNEIYPYIYLSLIFVIVSFILHLGIFILLFRNNKPSFFK
jgi:hypothetical protein